MQLTDEQKETLTAHFAKKWHDRNCPICRSNDWSLSDKVFELREYAGGSLIIGSTPIFPVVALACTNCGYSHFFNAIVLGIVPQSDKKGGEE